jgi:hypothetical protein
MRVQIKKIKKELAANDEKSPIFSNTIFHELIAAGQLEAEKSIEHLAEEGQIFVQAGTEPVSWSM